MVRLIAPGYGVNESQAVKGADQGHDRDVLTSLPFRVNHLRLHTKRGLQRASYLGSNDRYIKLIRIIIMQAS